MCWSLLGVSTGVCGLTGAALTSAADAALFRLRSSMLTNAPAGFFFFASEELVVAESSGSGGVGGGVGGALVEKRVRDQSKSWKRNKLMAEE